MRAVSTIKKIAIPVIAIIFALILGAIIISLCGYSYVDAYRALYQGSFSDSTHLFEKLVKATPLMFTALSYAIASKCGIINLGAEGQLYIGALFATVVGTCEFGLPMPFHLAMVLAAAFLGGGLYGMLAMWMKNRFGASELITTIMLNYIAILFVSYCVTGPLKDADTTFTQSKKIVDTATLPALGGSRLHFGFLLAVLFLVLYYLFLNKTVKGYQMRVVGKSYDAARYAGIDYKKSSMLAMFLAGGVAGLAGSCEILGVQGKLVQNFSANLGFDGIAVALLGGENPIGMFFSGILFGGLQAGANKMQMLANVPSAVVNIIQATIILMIAGRQIVSVAGQRIRRDKGGVL